MLRNQKPFPLDYLSKVLLPPVLPVVPMPPKVGWERPEKYLDIWISAHIPLICL